MGLTLHDHGHGHHGHSHGGGGHSHSHKKKKHSIPAKSIGNPTLKVFCNELWFNLYHMIKYLKILEWSTK